MSWNGAYFTAKDKKDNTVQVQKSQNVKHPYADTQYMTAVQVKNNLIAEVAE